MSTLVSDERPHMKTAWHGMGSTRSPSATLLLPQPQPSSSAHNAFASPFATSFEHKLAPITTAFEPRNSISSAQTPSTNSGTLLSSQATSPPQSPPCRSAKRPRWHYHQDIDPLGSTRRIESPPVYSSASYERRHDLPWAQVEARPSPSIHPCANCSDTHTILEDIVNGLLGLDIEIRHALTFARTSQSTSEHPCNEITKHGLKHSLTWASQSIRTSKLMVRDVTATRIEIPSSGYSIGARPDHGLQPDSSGFTSVPGDYHPSRHSGLYEKASIEPSAYSRSPPSPEDLASRLPDTVLPPLLATDAMKKAFYLEPTAGASPRRTPSSSVFGPGQSPSHSHSHSQSQSQPSHRTLPSPSIFQFPSGNLSPTHNLAAQAAHLQDLQHQISTKTLALQTLQREHDQLLAAFSRSQIRCSTLDKKSHVSDHEINSLTEEKIRLQLLAETLETQVEELVAAREEAQKQSTTEGQQWRQIVAMGSQLQAQGAEQTKQYKADKESWERDREGLQNRIQELEAGKLTLLNSRDAGENASAISSDDVLSSASLDVLREEILKSRRNCARMEAVLQEIQNDAEQMDQAMTTMADIRERITAKTRASLPAPNP